jgi:competence protein ComGF
MLKDGKGFTMAETLMAFSIWSMISLILLPASVYLKKEREENKVHQHIESLNFENLEKENVNLFIKDQEFKITWSKEEDIDQACINWESHDAAKEECMYSFRE